ncbi:hypothetical protein ACQP3J_32100, partial [Escherichia coli]
QNTLALGFHDHSVITAPLASNLMSISMGNFFHVFATCFKESFSNQTEVFPQNFHLYENQKPNRLSLKYKEDNFYMFSH